MPGQRHESKRQLSVWVQNMDDVDAYCKETGKNKTEVIQELIDQLKKKTQSSGKNSLILKIWNRQI